MRRVTVPGVFGGLLTLGVALLYVWIILSEGDDPIGQWAPWAAGLTAIGLTGIAASLAPSGRPKRATFAICAVATFVVGVLAIFSVGAMLLVAGLLFAAAAR